MSWDFWRASVRIACGAEERQLEGTERGALGLRSGLHNQQPQADEDSSERARQPQQGPEHTG